MPQIKMPLVLDLPTPLTRRRQRARIAAGLMAGLLAIPLALLVIPAPRIAPTSSTDNLLPDDVALTETIPALVIGAAIIAEPSTATALPIHMTPADAIPMDAWIRIAGLPLLASLSEGYEIAPGLWGVPPAALPKLKITAPSGRGIRSMVSVALMSSDGRVLTEAQSVFAVMPAQQLLNRDERRTGGAGQHRGGGCIAAARDRTHTMPGRIAGDGLLLRTGAGGSAAGREGRQCIRRRSCRGGALVLSAGRANGLVGSGLCARHDLRSA